MADFARDSMLEMFTFEMNQLVEQLEQQILNSEDELSEAAVNEIFRIMHTIKGSAAMMLYNNIADATHKIEDMFFFIREKKPEGMDNRRLTDIVLAATDFVKEELAKIEAGEQSDGEGKEIMEAAKEFMAVLKGEATASKAESDKEAFEKQKASREKGEKAEKALQEQDEEKAKASEAVKKANKAEKAGKDAQAEKADKAEKAATRAPKATDAYDDDADVSAYKITLNFEPGCEMENVRAYTVVRNLEPITLDIDYIPRGIDRDDKADECIDEIRQNGFKMHLITDAREAEVKEVLEQTIYMEKYTLELDKPKQKSKEASNEAGEKSAQTTGQASKANTAEAIVEPTAEQKATAPTETKSLKEAGGKAVLNEALEPKGNAKSYFKIMVKFEDGCEMENIRSYTVLRNLEQIAVGITYEPSDILENEDTAEIIRRKGFQIQLKTDESYDRVKKILEETVFLKEMTIEDAEAGEKKTLIQKPREEAKKPEAKQEGAKAGDAKKPMGGSMISVSINKLDSLLNLTGELVTSEAMVTQNPDLAGLDLENFQKAVRQLRKIINDIQDTVMSMRMVPLSPTFAKMHRIVRDMCKQLGKDVTLELIGEDTEVDKNIIEHISDPLMHIIRNSIDHGIETTERRREKGKQEKGTVILEARNAGGDVLITVRDDGAGIDKERVLNKARNNGMLKKSENEYSDKEIYSFIFAPGFSTNEEVTAYSGRGVGMDVVTTNIEQVGGSVIVDSEPGQGTTTTLKIPLTLAIINGMIVEINKAKYTIPINTIKESFKAAEDDILTDPDGNEMIVVRGECYNVLRLHEFFGLNCERLKVDDGIMIMLENDEQTIVVLANELIGEQQVVVKAIPKYIKKVRGLSGCTLLGNGDISLIVDSAGFFND